MLILRKLLWIPLVAAMSLGSARAGDGALDQPEARSAEQFLRTVYARYQTDGEGVSTTDRGVYASGLRELMRAEEASAPKGDVGWLDFDPLCDCQDFSIDQLKIVIQSTGDRRLEAAVSFRNLDETVRLHLKLRSVAKGWRISDIVSPSWGGSLRDRLQQQIRSAAR